MVLIQMILYEKAMLYFRGWGEIVFELIIGLAIGVYVGNKFIARETLENNIEKFKSIFRRKEQ